MKKHLLLFKIFLCLGYIQCYSQAESFTVKQVLNQAPSAPADRYYLQHPFEILYGPDDSLWISEKRGRVIKVDPLTGKRRIILSIPGSVKFTTGGSPVSSIKQDGMMGLALHPDYPAVDSFFVAYVYDAGAGVRKLRIGRFPVKNSTITTRTGNETVIIQNIPAGDDHSSGRMLIGADRKIYYAVGDLGANQFGLRCNPVRSQDVPTVAELGAGNYIAYQGKILRINMDGTIPADNPVIKTIQSHIYSFGHRNPNSIVFAKNGSQQDFGGAKLYSAENGPAEDDEINQILPGKNYGWPYISGYRDNKIYQYKNWSSASNCSSQPSPGSEPECSTPPATARIMNETDTTLPDFQVPMRTFFTPSGSSIACNWLSNPTVAPASMDYYGFSNKIPGWQNSILMTTLKEGTVFRLKLSADGNSFVNLANGSDTARYFREENRIRDMAIGKDGITFYLVTDSVGQTSGPTTGNTNILNNRGGILVYKYTGAIINLVNDPLTAINARIYIKMFPNPTTRTLYVESKRNVSKPIFYQLYDITGRLMLNGTSNRDNFEINVEKLGAGIYTVKLYNGQDINLLTEKIVIQ